MEQLPAAFASSEGAASGGKGGGGNTTASIGSTFDIVIRYSGDSTYQTLFDAAAARWEQIITADIPDVNSATWGFIDDLLIDASVTTIDGPGGLLAQAGPDELRSGSRLPDHGEMEFDNADVGSMFGNGTLDELILHEMGHVLGFGTIWSNLGLKSGFTFTGAHAVAEYQTLTGDFSKTSVPLETGGGSGTAGRHWSEAVFNNELMTGFVEPPGVPMPLSRLTIASMWDLGYTVNLSAADSYTLPGGAPPPVGAPLPVVQTPHDFSGDGKADILWQNDDGRPAVWLMNGTGIAALGPGLLNPGPTWHARDGVDFDGDGKADILWQNDSGAPAVWLMNGTGVAAFGPALANPGPTWHANRAGDFNGDAKADVLWQNDDGTPAIWLMNGTSIAAFGPALANPGLTWNALQAADFNADGKADILWQNDDGRPAVWLMNGTNLLTSGAALANPGSAWHVRGAGDFNGDGKADILWQNDDGTPAVWLMNGTSVAAFGPALANPGPTWHVKEAEDTNGDGRADILWQNDDGTPAVWLMNGVNVAAFGPSLPDPGPSWHVI